MLIAITGVKTSGKSTFAGPLINRGFREEKFAGPMKEMLRTLYRSVGMSIDDIEAKVEGHLKDEFCPILGNTPRHAMETLGGQWREMVDPDLWVRLWATRVHQLLEQGHDVVCSDLRHLAEEHAVRELGGRVVKVFAEWAPQPNDGHKSEMEMVNIRPDVVVENVAGRVGDLQQAALGMLE